MIHYSHFISLIHNLTNFNQCQILNLFYALRNKQRISRNEEICYTETDFMVSKSFPAKYA